MNKKGFCTEKKTTDKILIKNYYFLTKKIKNLFLQCKAAV